MVSREHAWFTHDEDDGGGAWRVHECGAPNGTHVNGVLVVDECVLADGDILRFGRV